MTLRPAMQSFVRYFGELGPRWGIAADTARAHALLYLGGRPMTSSEVAAGLELEDAAAISTLRDLEAWGMARPSAQGRWETSGEPWDLLFAGLEERRRREIKPAIETMRACAGEAAADAETPAAVRNRIERMLRLVEDLAAIDGQVGRMGPGGISRMVGFGAGAARLIDRILPRPGNRSRR